MDAWLPPPPRLALADDEVHVWRVWLDRTELPSAAAAAEVLADDERARIARLRLARDRRRRAAGRAWLRSIVSRYLACDPTSVRFEQNAYGKPRLAASVGATGSALTFNMSYAGELALYAIAVGRDVGIDCAQLDIAVACGEVATHAFSAVELAQWRALPAEDQRAAFFACWTRKEAYIKARGLGLSLDLRRFDVSVAPAGPAALLGTREPGQMTTGWALRDLAVGKGYAAALAVQTACAHLALWDPSEASGGALTPDTPGSGAAR